MKGSALLLTDDIVVSSTVVLSVSAAIRDITAGEPGCSIITQASALSKLPFDSSSMDAVVCIAKNSALHDDDWIQEIFRVLKPGSIILVQSSIPPGETVESSITLERKLLLAGFSEVQTIQIERFLQMEISQYFTVKAKKALWEVGSSFTIKKPIKPLPKIQIDDDSDFIDEDTLLTEEDLIKPQLPSIGDCEIGNTRKACKNCTCGQADTDEQNIQKLSLTAEQMHIPQSACGNCGLGDAFRCGGCPYRGLPPFRLGDKVSLAANFLVADI